MGMCTNHGYESNLVKIDEEERAEEKRGSSEVTKGKWL